MFKENFGGEARLHMWNCDCNEWISGARKRKWSSIWSGASITLHCIKYIGRTGEVDPRNNSHSAWHKRICLKKKVACRAGKVAGFLNWEKIALAIAYHGRQGKITKVKVKIGDEKGWAISPGSRGHFLLSSLWAKVGVPPKIPPCPLG